MAASDDLRFQGYLLEEHDSADLYLGCAHGFYGAQAQTVLSRVGSAHGSANQNEGFILWDAKDEAIIGCARIYRPVHCVFTGGYIVEDMRGQQLIDLLYKARLQFLYEEKYHGEIIIHTGKNNHGTRGAALRSGFTIDPDETVNTTLHRQAGILQYDETLERARFLLEDRTPKVEMHF